MLHISSHHATPTDFRGGFYSGLMLRARLERFLEVPHTFYILPSRQCLGPGWRRRVLRSTYNLYLWKKGSIVQPLSTTPQPQPNNMSYLIIIKFICIVMCLPQIYTFYELYFVPGSTYVCRYVLTHWHIHTYVQKKPGMLKVYFNMTYLVCVWYTPHTYYGKRRRKEGRQIFQIQILYMNLNMRTPTPHTVYIKKGPSRKNLLNKVSHETKMDPPLNVFKPN